jgi:hypothetical protein
MNLEQAIHQRWAAAAALCQLLPADRLHTGLARGTGTPYATLLRKPSRTLFRTNAGDALEEVPLVIHVWHDRFDAGQAIARQVQAVFDRSDFSLSDGGRVVQMRRAGESVVEHDDGVWQWAIEFSVQVYLPSGH